MNVERLFKSESMISYVALLYAVNVGGTGKLLMSDLKSMCEAAGFAKVRTYIASGNVVFQSNKSEAEVKSLLEKSLLQHAGKPIGVSIRTSTELAAVLASNPFKDAPGNQTVAIFLSEAPPKDTLSKTTGQRNEQVALGKREIYAFYPDGIGDSKLKIAAAKSGTGRNMNTIAKLSEMLNQL